MVDGAALPHELAAKRKLPALAKKDVVPVGLFLNTLAIAQLVRFPALLGSRPQTRVAVRRHHDEGEDEENETTARQRLQRSRNRARTRAGSFRSIRYARTC